MCADALTKAGLDLSALIELMHGNWRIAEEWKQAKVPEAYTSKSFPQGLIDGQS